MVLPWHIMSSAEGRIGCSSSTLFTVTVMVCSSPLQPDTVSFSSPSLHGVTLVRVDAPLLPKGRVQPWGTLHVKVKPGLLRLVPEATNDLPLLNPKSSSSTLLLVSVLVLSNLILNKSKLQSVILSVVVPNDAPFAFLHSALITCEDDGLLKLPPPVAVLFHFIVTTFGLLVVVIVPSPDIFKLQVIELVLAGWFASVNW